MAIAGPDFALARFLRRREMNRIGRAQKQIRRRREQQRALVLRKSARLPE
jgi:hypothetical protein